MTKRTFLPPSVWAVPAAFAIVVTIFQAVPCAFAANPEDKRQLEHADYANWKTLSGQTISNDGKWLSFVAQPGTGDGALTIREIATARAYTVPGGGGARFTFDSQYVVYTIAPPSDLIKKLQKEKKPASELPKPKLEILHLASGNHTTIEQAGRFEMPAKAAGWIAFKLLDAPKEETVEETKATLTETFNITPEGIERPEKEKEYRVEKQQEPKTAEETSAVAESAKSESASSSTLAEKSATKNGKGKSKKERKPGSTLVLRNIESGMELRFPYVVNSRFSENGAYFAFTVAEPITASEKPEEAKSTRDGVYVFDIAKLTTLQVYSGRANYGQVVFSKDGQQLAFLSDHEDFAAEEPLWSMYLWKKGRSEAAKVAHSQSNGIPNGWILSSATAPNFSENGKRLVFRTRPKPEEANEEEDKDPVAKLDIWHWKDPFLQPEQLLRAAAERERSYEAMYDIAKRSVIQLATKEIPVVSVDLRSNASVAVGVASAEYDKMRSWDIQSYSDWYLIDLKTGDARLLAQKSRGTPQLSPDGKFVTWWDGEQQTYFALTTALPKSKPGDMRTEPTLGEPVNLGSAIEQPLFDELHDQPSLPRPYGTAGWTEDDKALLIYDRWDIWQVDPAGVDAPVCLTDGEGRKQQIEFRNVRLDSEQRTVDLTQPLILSATVHATKASGYYRLGSEGNKLALTKLLVLDERVSDLRKAKHSDAVMFTRSTFERCPDLWTSTLEFETTRRMSRINPQQDEFRWGSAELVHWNADDGQALDGILYKPEGFDAEKQYPLLVYFYERNSDNLHTYYPPAAGRSIINFSFYVSRGYVVFIPDIPYKVGEPGPSAANAILPGVKHLVDQGFIDEKRIGMQGHSWGGYQTAYLVTVTDMFACAESGAPVSNMTSAYGGIRWGSGMSRMFQYEKTQSRIGATLWEAREKYIANSPLFAADKIKTPLLILHNDEDTAVPWYQGIELFVALRRLEQPAWMLNYNGDPHWVMSDENRMDFAIRMQQFFDHYLKGEPMPVWMAEGLPAVDKGKEFGLEYIKPAGEEAGAEQETNES